MEQKKTLILFFNLVVLQQWDCYGTFVVKQESSRNNFNTTSAMAYLPFECPNKTGYRSQIKPHLVYRKEERQKCCTKKWEAGTVEEDCEEEEGE